MKRCKVTEEEIRDIRRKNHEKLVNIDIENAKTIVIEKKGDFLRIGTTLINLKNVDLIICNGFYNFDNMKIVDLYNVVAFHKEALEIITKRILEVL